MALLRPEKTGQRWLEKGISAQDSVVTHSFKMRERDLPLHCVSTYFFVNSSHVSFFPFVDSGRFTSQIKGFDTSKITKTVNILYFSSAYLVFFSLILQNHSDLSTFPSQSSFSSF